jgi:ribosomal protein L40E
MQQRVAERFVNEPTNRTARSRYCRQCGVVNFADAESCRRCRSELVDAPSAHAARDRTAATSTSRGIGRRLGFIAGAIVLSVFGWSRSLLLTSTPIDAGQRQLVMQAILVLKHSGFSREAAMLGHFANYRATDNWWNSYLGHREAYAATNFPLGVVTLYPRFFNVACDDTERAAILLHEAQHLLGAGEPAALELTWREKHRLGWSAEKYGESRVWKNTKEWTTSEVPSLFRCGADGHSDCAM